MRKREFLLVGILLPFLFILFLTIAIFIGELTVELGGILFGIILLSYLITFFYLGYKIIDKDETGKSTWTIFLLILVSVVSNLVFIMIASGIGEQIYHAANMGKFGGRDGLLHGISYQLIGENGGWFMIFILFFTGLGGLISGLIAILAAGIKRRRSHNQH